MKPKVSINILNWNEPDDTLECIESCSKIDYPNFEILVIDNHSSDDSVERIKEKYPQLRVIQNDENYGYAGGNNVGIKDALANGADYILILNNDTTAEPDCISLLVEAMQNQPKAGMAAPKVLYYDDPKTINSLGTTMNWLKLRPYLGFCNQEDRKDWPQYLKKDILLGCALFVSKETIERIGSIDDRFFIFHEEADWCLRNLKSEHENIVVPQSVIYHKSSKTMRKFSLLTHYYSIRNFLFMAHRNATLTQLMLVYTGLCYLTAKHLLLLMAGNHEKKAMGRAFVLGVWDYFGKRLGKCQRTFQAKVSAA